MTLPLPGSYIVENLTTGNFNLIFRGITATEVIASPPGERNEIYNDGANVRFVGLGRIGKMEHWVGLSAMPAWVAACTKRPYLLCDSTVYNISDYPYLGGRLLGRRNASPGEDRLQPMALDGGHQHLAQARHALDRPLASVGPEHRLGRALDELA